MTFEHIATVVGIALTFVGLGITIWKVRKEDWLRIDSKIQSVVIDLAAFKIHVAERHPTVGGLAEAERRFTEAHREVMALLGKISDRIDRIIEQGR